MEWSGVEWAGVEWSGWSGVEWRGVEWRGGLEYARCGFMVYGFGDMPPPAMATATEIQIPY